MLSIGEVVTGLNVVENTYQKTEPAFVRGRPHHSLSFRRCGQKSLVCGKVHLLSGPGSITYTPQGTSYHTEVQEEGSMIVVHFTTAGGTEEPRMPEVFIPEHESAIRSQFISLLDRYKPGREQDYTCLSLFYDILASIQYEQTRGQRAAIPQRMLAAREYMEQHFGDAGLTIPDLAQQAGVSDVYFRREFKRCFGLSPLACLKKIRLDNARLLLASGYDTISEIAFRCGFESLTYFSYEFHRLTGKTPSEFTNEFRE